MPRRQIKQPRLASSAAGHPRADPGCRLTSHAGRESPHRGRLARGLAADRAAPGHTPGRVVLLGGCPCQEARRSLPPQEPRRQLREGPRGHLPPHPTVGVCPGDPPPAKNTEAGVAVGFQESVLREQPQRAQPPDLGPILLLPLGTQMRQPAQAQIAQLRKLEWDDQSCLGAHGPGRGVPQGAARRSLDGPPRHPRQLNVLWVVPGCLPLSLAPSRLLTPRGVSPRWRHESAPPPPATSCPASNRLSLCPSSSSEAPNTHEHLAWPS